MTQTVATGEKLLDTESIVKAIVEDLLKSFPDQKQYIRSQEKLKGELDNLNITHKSNKIALEKLDLELSKFRKSINNSVESQEIMKEKLSSTLDHGLDDIRSTISSSNDKLKNTIAVDLESITQKLLNTLSEDFQKIEHELGPLKAILTQSEFEKFQQMLTELLGEKISNIIREITRNAEIIKSNHTNLIEILNSNQALLLNEIKNIPFESLITKLHNLINSEITKNSTEFLKQFELMARNETVIHAREDLSKQINESHGKIINTLGEAIPTQFAKLFASIKELDSQSITSINKKLDESLVPDMIKSLQEQLNTVIYKEMATLQGKIDASPVSNQIESLQKTLSADLGQAISKILDNQNKSPLPAQISQLSQEIKTQLVSNLINSLEKLEQTELNSYKDLLQKMMDKLISQLAHQQSLERLGQDVTRISQSLSPIAKEVTLEKLKEEIRSTNSLPEVRKSFAALSKMLESMPKDATVNQIYSGINQILKIQQSFAKEQTLTGIEKLIRSQDSLPVLNKLIPELKQAFKPLARDDQLKELQKSTTLITNSISTLPNQTEISKIRKTTEETIPSLVNSSTKDILSSQKELQSISSSINIQIDKLKESLGNLAKFSESFASKQSVSEFRLLYENTFPTLKGELTGLIGKLEKDHQNQAQFIEKASVSLEKVARQTEKVPELTKFVVEDLYPQMFSQHQDLLGTTKATRENSLKLLENIDLIAQKMANESSLEEIRTYASEKGFKKFLIEIKNAILPVVYSYVENLAQQESINVLNRDMMLNLQNIMKYQVKQSEAQDTDHLLLIEYRKLLAKLPVKEEFSALQGWIDTQLSEKLPQLIEDTLINAAREESLQKLQTEFRGDLKDLFQIQTLIQEAVKLNQTDLIAINKSAEGFHDKTQESLIKLMENTSPQAQGRLLEEIKANLARLAKNESVIDFKNFYTRQSGVIAETTEDIKEKVLINQKKINELGVSLSHLTTSEDLVNLGEFMVEQVKNPVLADLGSKINALAKEDTLSTNQHAIMEEIQKLMKHDEFVEIKNEQEKTNKFLFKVAKFTEQSQENMNFLDEQLRAISEKISLLFEFIKRVSGV